MKAVIESYNLTMMEGGGDEPTARNKVLSKRRNESLA